MILNASGRTDIIAFYSDWFFQRMKEGYLDVRNPFYPKQVSRIFFSSVDAIVFCTKNPIPLLSHLDEIKVPFVLQVTLTGYGKDIEPFVPDKKKIILALQEVSKKIGRENVFVRYDPIFLNKKYTVSYHIRSFRKLVAFLAPFVSCFIISFLDDYKNVNYHQKELQTIPFKEEDYKQIGIAFSMIAKEHQVKVQTCAEKRNLTEYGFSKGSCVDLSLAYRLTGKSKWKKWSARKNKFCECVQMVDVGVYNTCGHFCRYCYANYDEKKVSENRKKHFLDSSLLIGRLEQDDIVKERKS